MERDGFYFVGILITAFPIFCNAQGKITEEQLANALPKPEGLNVTGFPFGPVTPTAATITWDGSKLSVKYDVKVWRVSDDRLEFEEVNHPMNFVRLEDLQPGTEYKVQVTAVVSSFLKSPPSEFFTFKTRDPCRSGKVYSRCYGHCHPTCKNKSPSCSRACVAGCACPPNMFDAEGICILEKNCEKEVNKIKLTGDFRKPTNLQMIPLKGGEPRVLLTWTPVPGADSYTATIIEEETGRIHEKKTGIRMPFHLVTGLKRRVRYTMVVTAVWSETLSSGARTVSVNIVPITAPTIVSVTETGFKISWPAEEVDNIQSFEVLLYDSDDTLLMSFRELELNYFTVTGLEPGTNYKVSVGVVAGADSNSTFTLQSPTVDVTTLGEFNISRKYPTGAFIETIVEVVTTTTTTTVAPTTAVPVTTCAEIYAATETFIANNPGAGVSLPSCNEDGDYNSQQCHGDKCVCVQIKSGKPIRYSEFPLKAKVDCDHYGSLTSGAFDVAVTTVDSTTVYVRWISAKNSRAHFVKIFNGVTGDLVVSNYIPIRKVATIKSLLPGNRYKVIVVTIDKDGKTSSDNVQGKTIFTPYLNPPRVRITEYSPTSLTVKWNHDASVGYYYVQLQNLRLDTLIVSLDNVFDNSVVFTNLDGNDAYQISVTGRSVRIDPTTGEDMVVESDATTVESYERCHPPDIDMLFGFDVSTKLSHVQLLKVKRMFINIFNALGSAPNDGTRVAAFKFSEMVEELFSYESYSERSDVIGEITSVQQSNSSLINLGKLVKFANQNYFGAEAANQKRENVPSATVVFISGNSDDTIEDADFTALTQATTLIAIGVENEVNATLVEKIRQSAFFFLSDSYSDLTKSVVETVRALCDLNSS